MQAPSKLHEDQHERWAESIQEELALKNERK